MGELGSGGTVEKSGRSSMEAPSSRRFQSEVDAMNYVLNEEDILFSNSTLPGRMV